MGLPPKKKDYSLGLVKCFRDGMILFIYLFFFGKWVKYYLNKNTKKNKKSIEQVVPIILNRRDHWIDDR